MRARDCVGCTAALEHAGLLFKARQQPAKRARITWSTSSTRGRSHIGGAQRVEDVDQIVRARFAGADDLAAGQLNRKHVLEGAQPLDRGGLYGQPRQSRALAHLDHALELVVGALRQPRGCRP